MAIRIVRLGTARLPDEGVRIGAVRRPPRGVPRSEYAARNYYDVWLPTLAPTPDLVKLALSAATPADWKRFVARYLRQMSSSDARASLNLLASLSHSTNFSIGCYCAAESHCHRGVLRQLLLQRGAALFPG